MKLPFKKTDAAIGEMLRARLPEIEQLGVGRWAYSLANGGAHPMTVRSTEDGWLVIDAPLRELATPGEAWELLQRNRRLEGLTKVVLAANNWSARLRAEIPLGDENAVERRLLETCAGFETVVPSFSGHGLVSEPQPLSPEDQAWPCDLATLCEEAGWASSQRSGAVLVELSGQRGFHQARLETEVTGGVRAFVPVVSCLSWSTESRWALAVLLLAASRVVRLARGFAAENNGLLTAGFEVRFGGAPSAFELAQALAALSAACGLSGEEAQVLGDPSVATAYLGIRGRSA